MYQIKTEPKLEDKIQRGIFNSELKASLAGLIGFSAYSGTAINAGINMIARDGNYLSGELSILGGIASAYFTYRSYQKAKKEYERLKNVEEKYAKSKSAAFGCECKRLKDVEKQYVKSKTI